MKEFVDGTGSTFKKFNLRFYSKNTAVPNSIVFDPNLKDVGKLLLIALHMLPDSWVVYQSKLAEMLQWGREKMSAAIESLVEMGYVRRSQNRAEKGRFSSYSFEFYWEPIFKDNPNIQEEQSPLGKPAHNKVSTGGGKTGAGSTGAGKPATTGYIIDIVGLRGC